MTNRLRAALGAVFAPLLRQTAGPVATPEQDFWQWFQKNESTLFDFEKDQERIFDRLAVAIQKVNPELTFEFAPVLAGRREFVISAAGNRGAFPAVEALYATAPKFARWSITKFRPRREPMDIEYAGLTVRPADVSVRIEHHGGLVDLWVFIAGFSNERSTEFKVIGYLILDQALGEYDVETRVGGIKFMAAPDTGGGAVPLHELPAKFDAVFTR